MGNHHSRLEHRSASTVSHVDPVLKQLEPWQLSEDNRYRRQYPLPTVSQASHGGNRIKMRKQSTPSPVTPHIRKPLARFLPFRSYSRSNSATSTVSDGMVPVSSDPPLTSQHHSSFPQTSVHPLVSVSRTHNNRISLCLQSPSSSALDATDYCETFQQHPQCPPPENTDQAVHPTDNNEYVWISGRKFHNTPGSAYLLPCDEEEIDRLHLQHFMVRFAIQGNYLAPVSDVLRKGGRVLDVGCGPGSWTMEIAGEYPRSQIVGIDITQMFPRDIKPANCIFRQCNVLTGLPFEECTFDYVFMRFISKGVEVDQWGPLIAELVRVLKPGGWIELVEGDTELHRAGPMTRQHHERLIELVESRCLDPNAGRRLGERLRNHGGLSNIATTFISCPGGLWAGKLGQLTLQSWKAYNSALRPQICLSEGITTEQYDERLQQCWKEADEYKTFENVHFAYAQKKSPVSSK
ncbi:uncharacterized protein BYT42DRAFT_556542 [Radiomyces spectabilis]|uniref:uncharacterized protein n=1 Tax=Radiomyces spectabilis TaxID=64574 RepID=UPI00221E514A|nr:uncharacterized protein BYT42DRAFT_556542 [Radiomyces spectabilis]KAI8391346.1 hypothetical protein BYT42DRAFT_556542 [Radiomyces spectabilis]